MPSAGRCQDTTIIERPKHPPPVNRPPVLPGHSGWESGAGPAVGENPPAKDRRPGPPAPAWIHPIQTSQWLSATPWIAATGALRDCPAALATCTNVAPNIGGFQARIAVTFLPHKCSCEPRRRMSSVAKLRLADFTQGRQEEMGGVSAVKTGRRVVEDCITLFRSDWLPGKTSRQGQK